MTRTTFLVTLPLAAMCLAALSLFFGVRSIAPDNVIAAFSAFDPDSADHVVIRDMRLPRALAALIGGGALGLAGALMQALSRNPLADPGLLGVNGGAAFGVVLGIWGLGITAQFSLVAPALAGATVAAMLVFLLGGVDRSTGPDPTRLVLAGAAIGALFLALTWAVLVLSRESLDVFRFWVLGGFDGIALSDLMSVLPIYALALPMAAVAASLLDPLVLGDDAARALGVRVGFARLFSVLAIVLLCGTTVSLAGPIAFVGLLVPHLVRPFVRADLRVLALGSFIAGGVLALTADILGRVILPGMELEAGAMMALIGGPALIAIVRTKGGVWS